MGPYTKQKLQHFITQHDAVPDINPHGPSSPPLQPVDDAASPIRASPPLGLKRDKVLIPTMIPAGIPKPARLGNSSLKAVDDPRTRHLTSQPRDGLAGVRPGWESAPPLSTTPDSSRDKNDGGLRERWEEQSNVQSLFSDIVQSRSSSDHGSIDREDTRSDILDDRPRARRGRETHGSSKGDLAKKRHSEGLPQLKSEKGQLELAVLDARGLSTSMITHAPKDKVPEAPTYQQNPFDTTSEEASPQLHRERGFLHSRFPHRGNNTTKGRTHVERAAFHMDAAKQLSPEKFDGETDAIHPQIFAKPNRIQSISDQRPVAQSRTKNVAHIEVPEVDSESDESDHSPLEQDYVHQPTPGAFNSAAANNDATVIFSPQQHIVPIKAARVAVAKEITAQATLVPRSNGQQPLSKKRRFSADYDDAALQKMSFVELQKEPFDHDPTKQLAKSPTKPPADNLGERLEFYTAQDEEAQGQFFQQMSLRDWEDSGDWFLGRFADIVQQMREARQDKRKMVEQYEKEVSNREEAVRRKKESIERKLSKLKHDGTAMMEGKGIDD
ncbi:extracellular mutant protein 11-domain-containing protein [Coniella lustricola]|uniref:Extracellular mutant protein 11-domain-containing protein n=1 Tax=Coniella lustricola TaxID=2025994 RepID=A0A2T3AKZ8_9PEZI|nr:extracellular mutant protein 11-domain-containing protein [Coniella lustricola]